MHFLRFLLLAGGVLGSAASAAAQGFAWARPLERALPPDPGQINFSRYLTQERLSATDRHGNTYVAGSFQQSLTIQDTTANSSGGRLNVFVARFDSSGTLTWLRTGHSPDSAGARPMALTLDRTGDPLLAVAGRAAFTMGSQTSPGATFFVSLDSTGACQWITPLLRRGAPLGWLTDLDVAPNGDISFTGVGNYADSICGLPYTTRWTGLVDHCLVVRCDSRGRGRWLTWLGPGNSAFDLVVTSHIASDQAGNLYVSGNSDGSVYVPFGNVSIFQGGFLIKYDPLGNIQWSKNAIMAQATGLAVAPDNSVYWAGDVDHQLPVPIADSLWAQPGFFLAKFAPNGAVGWVRGLDRANQLLNVADVATDANSRPYVLAHYQSDSIRLGGTTLARPDSTDLLVAAYAADGRLAWAATGGGADHDYARMLSLDQRGNAYVLGRTLSATGFGGAPLTATPAGSALRGSYFLTKLRRPQERNRLTGVVYLDANANGVRDAGEPAFPRPAELSENRTGQRQLVTGAFTLYADTGRYDLRLSALPAHYTLTQGTGGYQGRLTSIGQLDSARHFGLAPVPNQPDVRVTLAAVRPARPGFTSGYRATVENVGTTTAGGTLTLHLAPPFAYQNSTPAATVSGNQLSWTYGPLAPLGRQTFDVTATLSAATRLGATVTTWAQAGLAADVVPADNADTLRQVVRGAYDPNDIDVNYDFITLAQVASREWLEYTIRFQNLGTDTAFSVVITDTLPAQYLDLRSLGFVDASHNVAWSADAGGVLTARFANIHLPHAALDSLGSQGFLRMRVRVRPTLVVGDRIPNRAHIVFDFNAPVTTNTALTIVGAPLGQPRAAAAASWSLHPNPAAERVALSAELATGGPVGVRVLDALGRSVRTYETTATAGPFRHTLDLSGLRPGVYVVQLRTPDGGTTTQRLVRQ